MLHKSFLICKVYITFVYDVLWYHLFPNWGQKAIMTSKEIATGQSLMCYGINEYTERYRSYETCKLEEIA